jgi:glutaredoxin
LELQTLKGEQMTLDNHILYYKPTCPFCVRVTNFMEQNGLCCEMRNTLEPPARDELEALTGGTQVPCLVIDGRPMLESADIIAYLRTRL